MNVDYVNHMGDDLMVVNAARVSFNKESEWDKIDCGHDDCGPECRGYSNSVKEADKKLINYLATHGHWTPFSHPTITVRVKAPIFVARQLFKHKVGMTENEVSRRYVDDEPEFYWPSEWRGRPTKGAKQGSSEETVKTIKFYGVVETWDDNISSLYGAHLDAAHALYDSMIRGGVAPEQARMILPQSMYTEWIWTGSLASFARIYKLRSDSHAQMETQEIAKMIDDIVRPIFPVSWSALINTKGD